MKIKILGQGCKNCRNLEKATINALAELDLAAEVIKEDDMGKIMSYGIFRTPALVINERIVLSGRVPSTNELKEIITRSI
jgi:small redox-active disulfide protein 2